MVKYYLIAQDEIADLATQKDVIKRTTLIVAVLARPYQERTALQAISSGIVKGVSAGIDALDKISEPPQKKGVKKP